MKIKWLIKLPLLLIIFASCKISNQRKPQYTNSNAVLWYDAPATRWFEALPVGNGRLGAMVSGNVETETIQINEESLWGGTKMNDNNPNSVQGLKEIQKLMLDGQVLGIPDLINKSMVGTPRELGSYQTFMNLILNYENSTITDYRRELDLINGISRITYNTGGVPFVQETFGSSASDVLVVRLESGKAFNVTIGLNREKDASSAAVSDNSLLLTGQIIDKENGARGPGGPHMKFSGRVKALIDNGSIKSEGNKLVATGITELTLLITGTTNYNFEKTDLDFSINTSETSLAIIKNAQKHSYSELKKQHIDDFSEKMKRVDLKLGDSHYDSIPTDKRLVDYYNGKEDLDLVSSYFQFGRYLLLSCSLSPGLLPANLQGIWNRHIQAPWNSDYHTNINLQMNYWPNDLVNLSETVLPLINFVEKLSISGAVTAKEMYGCEGWSVNHCTDVFTRTGAHDGSHGVYPLGGAWMTFPLWRYYEFTGDKKYLKEKGWPVMKGAAIFALDFLLEDKNGYLVTVPSSSPENAYIEPVTKERTGATIGSAMDMQIIRELFTYSLKAIDIVGSKEDEKLKTQLLEALPRLLPTRVGKDGSIMEWYKDYEEADPHHRHVSHLLGLYPGTQIVTEKTPELAEAARKVLLKRGDQGTGWSLAWKINFWARLQDGNHAYKILKALLKPVYSEKMNMKDGGGTFANFFCAHPPFQIDGNLGGLAGIAEMLLQSHEGFINVLPAIPDSWSSGKVVGLKARGGFELSFEWERGKIKTIQIKSLLGNKCKLKYGQNLVNLDIDKGETILLDGSLRQY